MEALTALSIAKVWAEHGGLLGLIILGLLGLVVWQHRTHRQDMLHWRDMVTKCHARADQLQSETNRLLRDLQVLITEIKGSCK